MRPSTGTSADLVELSHTIHEHPETAFEEDRAAAWTAESLAEGGFAVSTGTAGMPTAFSAEARVGADGGGGVRRVRRPARDGPRLRAQHHRRLGGRGRAGSGRTGRRARHHRPGAGHAGRRGRRRQGGDAGRGRLRGRPRRHDGAPVADRPAAGHLPGGGPLRRDLHRQGRPCIGRPLGRGQRRGRHGDRPGGPRTAAPTADSRRPGARRRDRRGPGRQHHPGLGHRAVHVPLRPPWPGWPSSSPGSWRCFEAGSAGHRDVGGLRVLAPVYSHMESDPTLLGPLPGQRRDPGAELRPRRRAGPTAHLLDRHGQRVHGRPDHPPVAGHRCGRVGEPPAGVRRGMRDGVSRPGRPGRGAVDGVDGDRCRPARRPAGPAPGPLATTAVRPVSRSGGTPRTRP